MILLDTNVVSEPLRPAPDPRVLTWLDRQVAESLYLSSVSLAELLLGAAVLPHGRRKAQLSRSLSLLIDELFGSRVLPFDGSSAIAFSELVANARHEGHAVSTADGQIASIASVHGFAVATRDKQPFAALGVQVIDPWHSAAPDSTEEQRL